MALDIDAADAALRAYATQLDELGRWDFWRTELGEYCVQIDHEGERMTFRDSGLLAAMRSAALWKPLPVVPLPPTVFDAKEFTPVKAGSKWRVLRQGVDQCVQFDTKRAARLWTELIASKSLEASQRWQQAYAWVRGKSEGIDFRYGEV